MTDIVRIRDKHYVRASSAFADDRTRILKYGSTIAVLNRFGDIEAAGFGQMGIFHKETRHLSRCLLQLNGVQPLLLSSLVHEDNSFLSVDLTNPDIPSKSGPTLPRETIHMYRSKFVLEDACHEKNRIVNYGMRPVRVTLVIFFAADFVDIFEVRGTKRLSTGTRFEDEVGTDHVLLSYLGLDNIVRRTELHFNPKPRALTAHQARYELELQPKQEFPFLLRVACSHQDDQRTPIAVEDALKCVVENTEARNRDACRVTSTNPAYDTWFRRSLEDLHLLTVGNPEGPYPYAGVPWFNTVFGRDGIITALETLWLFPSIAKAVLSNLAELQATTTDPENDSQPGKILHEMRRGEMANTGEIPFRRYYGSVDATPLYVVLAGAYLLRTGETEFVRGLWPNIEAALEWINRYGDPDGDCFIEYNRQSTNGLVQQGWKDSNDSIFHADGELARPPIALCEVQAYAYAAKRLGAKIATVLGKPHCAERLSTEADQLRATFEHAFWDDALGTYALALDGNKQRCRVRSSNAGQILFCHIASQEHANRVRNVLLDGLMYSGWGIRTIAADEVRYNPISYHNGSIWPHDNALIALGLALYGFQQDSARIMQGFKDASIFIDLQRLPELFCGFHKRNDATGPTLYPVACSPQAWSAGAAFLLLRAALGVTVRSAKSIVTFANPHLPVDLNDIFVENVRIADAVVDISVRRQEQKLKIELIPKHGKIDLRLN